jgi:hypothetical protein
MTSNAQSWPKVKLYGAAITTLGSGGDVAAGRKKIWISFHFAYSIVNGTRKASMSDLYTGQPRKLVKLVIVPSPLLNETYQSSASIPNSGFFTSILTETDWCAYKFELSFNLTTQASARSVTSKPDALEDPSLSLSLTHPVILKKAGWLTDMVGGAAVLPKRSTRGKISTAKVCDAPYDGRGSFRDWTTSIRGSTRNGPLAGETQSKTVGSLPPGADASLEDANQRPKEPMCFGVFSAILKYWGSSARVDSEPKVSTTTL